MSSIDDDELATIARWTMPVARRRAVTFPHPNTVLRAPRGSTSPVRTAAPAAAARRPFGEAVLALGTSETTPPGIEEAPTMLARRARSSGPPPIPPPRASRVGKPRLRAVRSEQDPSTPSVPSLVDARTPPAVVAVPRLEPPAPVPRRTGWLAPIVVIALAAAAGLGGYAAWDYVPVELIPIPW